MKAVVGRGFMTHERFFTTSAVTPPGFFDSVTSWGRD